MLEYGRRDEPIKRSESRNGQEVFDNQYAATVALHFTLVYNI